MGRKLGLDGQAVAYAVLEQLLEESALRGVWVNGSSPSIAADHLLKAGEVEFQPRARKLILTFDLAEPEDEPVPAAAPYDDTPVPYVPAVLEPAPPVD